MTLPSIKAIVVTTLQKLAAEPMSSGVPFSDAISRFLPSALDASAPVTPPVSETPAVTPVAPMTPVAPLVPPVTPPIAGIPHPDTTPATPAVPSAHNVFSDLKAKGQAFLNQGKDLAKAKSFYTNLDDLEGSDDYKAFQAANPQAGAPQAFQSVMGTRIAGALGSGDPAQIGTTLGYLGRASAEGNPNAEQAKTLLGSALQDASAKLAALPPEQQAAYKTAFQNNAAESLLPPDPNLRQALKTAGVDPVKMFTDKVTQETVKGTKAWQDYTGKLGADKATVGSVWDMLKDNPMNFLVPAGALVALLFDGKVPKLLGALAAGYGAYNLYDRYKAISDPKDPAAALIGPAMQRETAKAQADPNAQMLSNPEETRAALLQDAMKRTTDAKAATALADRAMQGLKDIRIAVTMGMGNRIASKALDTGRGVLDLVGGNPEALKPAVMP